MKADSVTILVPTTGRPALLRTALASIAAQTAIHRIAHVLVSENGGDATSRAVAMEFSGLIPVEYVLREPPLPALTHAQTLTQTLPAHGFMAILHDDDWWMPGHLAAALARMEANPQAIASYASHFIVSGESSMLASETNLFFWFAAGYPALSGCWELDETTLLLSCLCGTPGHYSTLLARAAVFKQAAGVVYSEGNPFDNDRLLIMELGRLGPVLYQPLPEVFIRCHADQDNRRFDWPKQQAYLRATTRRLAQQARNSRIDLRAHLTARLETCPPSARKDVFNALSQEWCAETLTQEHLAPEELMSYAATRSTRPNIRHHIGRVLPPVLLEALSRWRRRMKRQ